MFDDWMDYRAASGERLAISGRNSPDSRWIERLAAWDLCRIIESFDSKL
jgi:hypothetical protein